MHAVVKPVILSFDQVDNQPRIRMTIGPFSNEQGELRSVVEFKIP